jgi:hypothetical protein
MDAATGAHPVDTAGDARAAVRVSDRVSVRHSDDATEGFPDGSADAVALSRTDA